MYSDEFKQAIADIQCKSYTVFSNLRFSDICLDKEIKQLLQAIDKFKSLSSYEADTMSASKPTKRSKKND